MQWQKNPQQFSPLWYERVEDEALLEKRIYLSVVVIYIVLLSVFEKALGKKNQNNKAENCAEKTKEGFMGWRKRFLG